MAGSVAAAVQSSIGSAAAGSTFGTFAALQSQWCRKMLVVGEGGGVNVTAREIF